MLETLLFFWGVVERIVELLKGGIEEAVRQSRPPLKEGESPWVLPTPFVLILAQIVGIIAAMVAQINVIAEIETLANVPPTAGVIFTGMVIGAGSSWINAIIELLYGWRNRLETTMLKATVETPTDSSSAAVASFHTSR